MTPREEFIAIFQNNIRRQGADKLLAWLDGTDFYTAPASTKYHLSCEGGLCKHSINVYRRLRALYEAENCENRELIDKEEEMIAVAGLLHDLCKVNFYKTEKRNRKNADGQWEQYDAYTINDEFPIGHGEKSVIMIQLFMKMRMDEIYAIRSHMGAWQDGDKANCGKIFEKNDFAVLLHIADMMATYLDEK